MIILSFIALLVFAYFIKCRIFTHLSLYWSLHWINPPVIVLFGACINYFWTFWDNSKFNSQTRAWAIFYTIVYTISCIVFTGFSLLRLIEEYKRHCSDMNNLLCSITLFLLFTLLLFFIKLTRSLCYQFILLKIVYCILYGLFTV